MHRPARVRIVVLAVVLIVGAAAAAYFFWPAREGVLDPGPEGNRDGAPADPRLTFQTKFRNVHPDVSYVGDAACALCHKELCDSFHQHAMGRSALLPHEPADGVEKFDSKSQPNFNAFGHDYRVEKKRNTYVQTEVVNGADGKPSVTTAVEVVAGIGSGTRGRSYLTARDGSLWQTGVSWFSEKQIWDASPGFGPGRHGQRPVLPGCLFCHVNHVKPVAGTLNRFEEPFFGKQAQIGCERCHGPGAVHVAEQTDGKDPIDGFDDSIVNPKHLPPDLREDVCRQCHFQGADRVIRRGRGAFDYRPGLPLDLFMTVFVKHPSLTDYHKSVGQVEQVSVSKCATASEGKFGCTSCHDPHKAPAAAEKETYYRQQCMNCHADRGCTEPRPARDAVRDACTVCHMPKAASANIAHTAVTDHRILRRPAPSKAGGAAFGELPIDTLAGYGKRGPGDAEFSRDFGIALATLAVDQSGRMEIVRESVTRLRAATERHKDDAEAWEALALVLMSQGEWSEALRAAEAAVAVEPPRELALATASDAALRARRLDRAVDYARRAIALNPGDPENRLRLVRALSQEERWVDAATELGTLLKMCPNHAQARAALAVCLHRQGKAKDALIELDRAAAIDTRQAPGLRAWFEGRIR